MVILMKISLFVPSHITGFFEIIGHADPLKKGSRGAGVVLDDGVLTNIVIEEGAGSVEVKMNGKSDPRNSSITYKTIDIIKNRFQLENKNITIEHEFKVPISAGFGVSAACALGTSLGIVKVLNFPLTFNKAASLAHLAEVEMKSGLGDVIAETAGGMVLRLKEGAPGYGRTDKIIQNDLKHDNLEKGSDLFIITRTLGKIETSQIIDDPHWKERINKIGKNLLDELLKRPDTRNFLKLSRKFAEKTSLMNSEVLEIVEIFEEETMGASMAMLGNTAFALSKTPDTSVEGVLVSKIDNQGCRYL